MRVALLVLLVLVAGAARADSPPTFTLAVGVVDATEHEADECYWTIDTGQHATIVAFHPKNMSCQRMRELKGKSIRLQAVVE